MPQYTSYNITYYLRFSPMDPTEKQTRQWGAARLELRPDQAALFDRALRMYEEKASFADIHQLGLDRDSAIWWNDAGRRLTGLQVVRSPLYAAVKDMTRQRAVEAGFLRDDSAVPTSEKPRLEDFLHDPAKS